MQKLRHTVAGEGKPCRGDRKTVTATMKSVNFAGSSSAVGGAVAQTVSEQRAAI